MATSTSTYDMPPAAPSQSNFEISGPESLRPAALREFAGQPDVVRQIEVILGAAKARKEPVTPHMLFAGPPGLGKTTLANIVATELELPLLTTAGPSIEKTGQLAALLVSLQGPSVVFIDEIHRLSSDVQEMLYSAMEDQRIDILVTEGATRGTAYQLDLEPFVLIGATTEPGRLGRPFLDRFGYVARLELYDICTLTSIVNRSAGLLATDIEAEAAAMIAARSRGTPRIANQLLGRVRDLAAFNGAGAVTADVAEKALALFDVDAAGLGKTDRAILSALVSLFDGGPVGLKTLAAAVNEDPTTIELTHEPYLMRRGLLQRTARGRAATLATYKHVGIAPDDDRRRTLLGLE